MTAIEMMHPQMDIGCKRIKTREIHRAGKAAELGLIPWDNCSFGELVSVFDTQMGAIACWLDGQSLAQTVFANLHYEVVDNIPDKKLRSMTLGTLKLAGLINVVIQGHRLSKSPLQLSENSIKS